MPELEQASSAETAEQMKFVFSTVVLNLTGRKEQGQLALRWDCCMELPLLTTIILFCGSGWGFLVKITMYYCSYLVAADVISNFVIPPFSFKNMNSFPSFFLWVNNIPKKIQSRYIK